jgi:hypothetical protein
MTEHQFSAKADLATVLRVLDRYLHRWHGHPEWDDIRASAYLSVAQALAKLPADHENPAGVLVRAGWLGAKGFLRSAGSLCRRYTRQGHALPETVSLTEDLDLLSGDFVPPLLDLLEAAP